MIRQKALLGEGTNVHWFPIKSVIFVFIFVNASSFASSLVSETFMNLVE